VRRQDNRSCFQSPAMSPPPRMSSFCLLVLLVLLLLFLPPTFSQPTIILPITKFGLANRLRLLASGIILANEAGARLEVIWIPSTGCGASLDDLLDQASLPNDLFTLHEHSPDSAMYLEPVKALLDGPWEGKATTLHNINTDTVNNTLLIRNVGLHFRNILSISEYEVIVIKANGQFIINTMPCTTYYERKQIVYQRLISSLQPALQSDVTTVLAVLQAPQMFGIHFRSFDERHDWPVVAPQSGLLNKDGELTEGDASRAGQWNDVAPLSSFLTTMKTLHQTFPTALFFVASNSAMAKRTLVDAFPKGVVFTLNHAAAEGDLSSRSDVTAVQLALIDFVVLARAELIVHSFGSSFGEEAAAVEGVASVRVRVGGDIWGVDVSKTQCNNPQLIALRGGETIGETMGEKVCFVDGLGREVCQPKLEMEWCGVANERFGLKEVYSM